VVRPLTLLALALAVLTCACSEWNIVTTLGSSTTAGGGKPASAAGTARPDDSPASRLQTKLRAVAPSSFAGLVVDGDRSLIVYATVVEPALSDAISEIQASTPGGVAVRVVSGLKNSLATLESVRDQISARQRDLSAQGVMLTNWGPDIVANRVSVGVHGLTPKISADLAREFGADRILVVEGALWYAL
jgi:hypothetical protein